MLCFLLTTPELLHILIQIKTLDLEIIIITITCVGSLRLPPTIQKQVRRTGDSKLPLYV